MPIKKWKKEFLNAQGRFHQDDATFDEQAYLDILASVPVYEARGGVDFDALAERYLLETQS